MVEHNKRVLETLNRYIGLGVESAPAPHYAVMLNGEWGCGKTYFVKQQWLKRIPNIKNYSFVYVSLFGLSSIDDIYSAVFGSLLNSDQLEKNILANLTSKLYDFSNSKGLTSVIDKVANARWGMGYNDVAKLLAKNWLSKKNEQKVRVLIIDDLERSNLDLKAVFGFVSEFLESSEIRVLFISYDNEIPDTDYIRIKEKIIGETLTIAIDSDAAIETFMRDIPYNELEIPIISSLIKEITEKLGYNNLRAIRQTLIKLFPLITLIKSIRAYNEYSYDVINISGREYSKENYLYLIADYFILTNIQKVMGDLTEENIGLAMSVFKHEGLSVKQFFKKTSEAEMKKAEKELDLTLSMYRMGFNIYVPIKGSLEFKIWGDYIWRGELDEVLITSLATEDIFDLTPNRYQAQNPLLLLHQGYWDYTPEKFYDLQNKLIEELRNGFYTDIIELVAAYAMLSTFEHWGILREIDNLDVFFEEIVVELPLKLEKGTDVRYANTINDLNLYDISYKGYQIYTATSKEKVFGFFKKLKGYYELKVIQNNKENVNQLVDLIIAGNAEISKLYKKLIWGSPSEAIDNYMDCAILNLIDLNKLWLMLDKTKLNEQRDLFSHLRNRYGLNAQGVEESYLVYEPEMIVLENLVIGYQERYDKAKEEKSNKISMYSYLLVDAQKTLDGFVEKIKVGKARLEHNKKILEK